MTKTDERGQDKIAADLFNTVHSTLDEQAPKGLDKVTFQFHVVAEQIQKMQMLQASTMVRS